MRRFVIFSFVIALVGASAIWSAPRGSEAQDATEDRVAALETQVTDLSTRVAQLEGNRSGDDSATSDEAEPQSGEDQGDVVAFKRTGKVGDNWSVKLLEVLEDPYQIDPSADWFTDWLDANPAGDGQQYFTLRLRITNTGTVAADPTMDLYMYLVGSQEFEFTRKFTGIPGGMPFTAQLRPDESIDVNIAWIIDTQDLEVLVLSVAPGFVGIDGEPVLFALR